MTTTTASACGGAFPKAFRRLEPNPPTTDFTMTTTAAKRPPTQARRTERGRKGVGSRAPRHARRFQIFVALSLNALPITLTDDSAIAAAATIGDSSSPKTG